MTQPDHTPLPISPAAEELVSMLQAVLEGADLRDAHAALTVMLCRFVLICTDTPEDGVRMAADIGKDLQDNVGAMLRGQTQ